MDRNGGLFKPNNMKSKLTILFLVFCLASTAQVPILREYRCDFLRDSTLYVYSWVTGVGGKLVPATGNHKFIEGDGGLYNALYRKANGEVYIIEGQSTNPRFLQYDTLGIRFTGIDVECHLQTNLAVRSDGTIWISGHDTGKWLTTDPNRKMNRWAKIPGQPALKFVDVTKGGANGNGVLVATTETGEVWTVNDGSTMWTKKSLPGPVQKVYASESNFYIALIDGQPVGWGQSRYLTGVTGIITGYVSLASYWGLTGKVIDLAVNGQTVHYITDDHRLWGYGDNMQGEVGVGWEIVNRREIMNSNRWKQYVWPWATATMSNYYQPAFIIKPQHIAPGALFKRVFGGGYYSFYWYAEDINGNLYSCGRNKAGVLSNGLAVSNESDLPNWGDVTKPTMINLNYVIPLPGKFIPGTVSAGKDTMVTTTSIRLNGSFAPSGTKTFAYEITGCQWKKLSGPDCNILNPGLVHTDITGLQSGRYSFELLVGDKQNGTMTDTVVVNVMIVNKSPTVNTFCKTVIGNSTILVANAIDTDGKITATEWDKVSGPAGDWIIDLNTDAVEIYFTSPGEYVYRFNAFDDGGANSFIDIKLVVYPAEGGSFIIMRKN